MNTEAQHATKSTLRLFLFAGMILVTILLGQYPQFQPFLLPLRIFSVAVHELCHALTCLLTGGTVSGLTIVADGAGHGGLTFCNGGWPFLYGQAGYIGETLVGCLLIRLSAYPQASKAALAVIGIFVGCAMIYFAPGAIFTEHRLWEGLGSMFWGMTIAALFLLAATKLSAGLANTLLLFIALQTAMDSITAVLLVLNGSLMGGATSDAQNLQAVTGIPSIFWALLWSVFSVLMVGWTLSSTLRNEWKRSASKPSILN